MKNKGTKRTRSRWEEKTGPEALSVDVRVVDLRNAAGGPLQEIFEEIAQQWPGASRVGTVHLYFDQLGGFHLHFAARGTCLAPAGALADVPVAQLPGYHAFAQADIADSPALEAAEALVTLPHTVSAHDERWAPILETLRAMHADPAPVRRIRKDDEVPQWLEEHRRRTLNRTAGQL